ncbi:hypothetical protein GOP47_0012218 [Adiantum capillus-veneris]|uniref:protein-serine/threonine phosphatase n=1 Tax=Adiantum capillus-veneris TaxID=13818 RepID=A0A9D4ZFG6_ADICA|nr:hypothetical protein GOP47_0012218 [Adiantum capillus-veneris]
MLSWLGKLFSACWRPVQTRYARMNKDTGDHALMRYKDLVQHACGAISMAVVQGNNVMEDESQVEIGAAGTFIGIYDGHGGPEAAQYACNHLYNHLQGFATSDNGGMSEDAMQRAFQATEEGFLAYVRRSSQDLMTVGACCLVGVIQGHLLYIANLGDSRAVLGSVSTVTGDIMATQLTADDNANYEEVREELKAKHPDDEQIVSFKGGSWRVKGIIQVTKSIGDLYLKSPDVNGQILQGNFRLAEPLKRAVLSADPTVKAWNFQRHHKFCIFASDGLWEYLSNEDACKIVHNHPRSGIARKLIRAALTAAAKRYKLRYEDLKKVDKKFKRSYHDDITVIVVFIDHGKQESVQEVSFRGGIDH